jgi:histidine triad (HIT) family protein
MVGVVRVGAAIRDALTPDGMNLISSAGSAAEQTVFHAHLHVVPRWLRDPIGPIWPPKERMSEVLREDLADAIRARCA